jgi:hypothetical protein
MLTTSRDVPSGAPSETPQTPPTEGVKEKNKRPVFAALRKTFTDLLNADDGRAAF